TPATTVSAGYARQRLSSVSFPGASGVFPDQSVWNAGVDASWDLDVFGRIRHSVQAQGALVGVAQEELRDVQVTFTAELARAYFELRGAQEQLEVARRSGQGELPAPTHDRSKRGLCRARIQCGGQPGDAALRGGTGDHLARSQPGAREGGGRRGAGARGRRAGAVQSRRPRRAGRHG